VKKIYPLGVRKCPPNVMAGGEQKDKDSANEESGAEEASEEVTMRLDKWGYPIVPKRFENLSLDKWGNPINPPPPRQKAAKVREETGAAVTVTVTADDEATNVSICDIDISTIPQDNLEKRFNIDKLPNKAPLSINTVDTISYSLSASVGKGKRNQVVLMGYGGTTGLIRVHACDRDVGSLQN